MNQAACESEARRRHHAAVSFRPVVTDWGLIAGWTFEAHGRFGYVLNTGFVGPGLAANRTAARQAALVDFA